MPFPTTYACFLQFKIEVPACSCPSLQIEENLVIDECIMILAFVF